MNNTVLHQAVHEVYGMEDSYVHMSSDCLASLKKRLTMPKQVVPTNITRNTPNHPKTPWQALACSSFSSFSTTFGSGFLFSTLGK